VIEEAALAFSDPSAYADHLLPRKDIMVRIMIDKTPMMPMWDGDASRPICSGWTTHHPLRYC
jgi:hypothetical protein